MISSSKRVIKHSDLSKKMMIEQYILPPENNISNQIVIHKKPVFPRYTIDGEKKEDSMPLEELPQEAFLIPEEQELKEEEERVEEKGEELPDPTQALLDEAREEAARIIEEARQQAADIVEAARAQARSAKDQARRSGYQAGYEDGQSEGRQKAEEEVQKEFQENLIEFQKDMRQALRSVEKEKEDCVHTYLEELKDCAVAIGEKVIHISLKSSGEVIKQMIVAATEKLKKTAWVKIYIDKYDYDMMMAADADVLEELSHLSDNIKFIVMDKEEDGSCIIEMPEEIVDISVNTQIENIRDILENIRI